MVYSLFLLSGNLTQYRPYVQSSNCRFINPENIYPVGNNTLISLEFDATTTSNCDVFNLNLSTYSYFGDRLFGLLSFSTSGPMIDVISITDSCSIGDAAKRNVSEFTVLFISCGSSFYHNGSSIAQSGGNHVFIANINQGNISAMGYSGNVPGDSSGIQNTAEDVSIT